MTINLRGFTTSIMAASLAVCVLLAGHQPASAAGAFSKFIGTWTGSGTVRLENGKREKIRCNGYYTERKGGNGLGVAIRCASASNKIEMRAGLSQAGGRVVGSWEERTFNAGGSVTGSSSPNSVRLSISGSITGTLTMNVNGNSQSVSLAGGGVGGVTISMRRR